MKDQLTDEQIDAVLKSLNEAITTGPWDKSNFLKAVGKNITQIRDDFLKKIGRDPAAEQASIEAASKAWQQGEQQEVYISLYSANGSDLANWERIIINLPRQSISRPIYALEEDLVNVIRHKDNKVNEGYVAIRIKKTNILELGQDKTSYDKFGKELLNLKDKTILLENITRFVHSSGVYHLEKNRLVKE